MGFVLIIIGFGLYANSVSAPFTFDDDHAIVVNEQIRHLATAFSRTEQGSPLAGRPLVSLTFAINYALGGLDPRGYRLANIGIHVICALLLFALLRKHFDPGIAFAMALIWMVHPLVTEPIDYVSQRTELMMGAFLLATVYFGGYGGSASAGHRGAGGTSPMLGGTRPTLAVICCALGMACKETMVVAPLIVPLYDWTFTAGSFRETLRQRRSFYTALCATWLILIVLLWSSPRGDSAGFAGASVPPWTYLMNQSVMIVRYLKLVFWPRGLVLDYGQPLQVSFADVAPFAMAIAGLVATAIVALVRKSPLGFLGAWFFLTLAPTSSIMPISTEVGAERRMYLPLMAVVVFAVVAVRWFVGARVRGFDGSGVREFGSSRVRAFVGSWAPRLTVAVVAVPLSIATYQRNAEYLSGLTLWQSVLDRWPPHARAHRNLAAELKLAGRPDEEIVHLRAAVKDLPEVGGMLGLELLALGRNQEAVDELRQYVRNYPRDADAWSNLGNALAALGRTDEALQAFQKAVDADPNNGLSQRNLALQYLQQNDFEKAVAHARIAARLTPNDPAAHNLLGLALIGQQQIDEAIGQFRASLALQPANNDAAGYLERTLEAVGREP